ncbi:MAG: hypothetical protein AB7D51_08585 [Desulfovibrionaceae bacterium]
MRVVSSGGVSRGAMRMGTVCAAETCLINPIGLVVLAACSA